MNIVHILTAIKGISNAIENFRETKDEIFLRKAERELDKLFLELVERIQV